MREFLMSFVTADELEFIGFCILIFGLAGELVVAFIPHERSKLIKSLTTVCVVLIIVGIWLERVGDEANKVPRRLIESQRQTIVELLKPYSGTPFEIRVALGAAEPLDLGYDIGDALKAAGWNWKDCPGGLEANNRPAVCFAILKHIEVHTDNRSLVDRSLAVVGALKAARLKDVRSSFAETAGVPVIAIIVGTKM